MHISIISSNEKTELEYDVYGNCYLIYNGKMYNIIIGKDNNPELLRVLEHTLFDLDEYDNKYVTGQIFSGTPSLKGSVEDELSKKEHEDSDEDDNNESTQYFPECKYFFTKGCDVEDTELMNDSDIDPLFKFYGDSLKKTRYGYPFNSQYNILVVEGNTKSKKIVFYSEEYNDTCSYRITLYTDGYIKCNVVGTTEKMYKIIQQNGELLIE